MSRPKDCDIVVLSRDPRRFCDANPEFRNLPGVSFLAGDIRSFAFPSGRFDRIIHGATDAVTTLSDHEMSDVIVAGTQRVIAFAQRCGAERLMFLSSGAVYGVQPPESELLAETFPCHPVTAYGKGKLAGEQMCAASGVTALLPRCFAFVGPYLNLNIHFAIGNFIRDALRGGPIEVQGDGRAYRSYLYAADLARWLWTILEQGEHARPYNVGASEAISIRDLACLVSECAGGGSEIRVLGKGDSSVPAPRYVPSVRRVADELGLTPVISLREGIERTMDFYRGGGGYDGFSSALEDLSR